MSTVTPFHVGEKQIEGQEPAVGLFCTPGGACFTAHEEVSETTADKFARLFLGHFAEALRESARAA